MGKGLDSADDLSISYSYSWLGLNRGRDFEQYRARYIHLLETAKPGTTDTTAKNLALGAFLDLAESCFPEDGAGPNDQMRFQEIEDSDLCGPVEKQRAQQLIAQAAQASRDELLEARAAIAEAGLLRFGELVANQPQLYLTAQLRKRDALIGGDERSAKFSYEWSMTNLAGSMSTSCHEKLNVGADQTCADAYKRYVADNEDSIAHGNRFSLSIEYIDVDESTIPFSTLLPDAGLADKTLDGARKNIWKLGWSRLFDTAPNLYRLDFVGSYEDVSDDPMRRDRLVATLSIERKVGKDWSIPLGIVYANHGQYLPEVDERLSAHVGLKFNVSDPDGN